MIANIIYAISIGLLFIWLFTIAFIEDRRQKERNERYNQFWSNFELELRHININLEEIREEK